MKRNGDSQEQWTLEGGGLRGVWEAATGRVVELTHVPSGFRFAGGDLGSAGFEVFDELERVRYSDRETPCRVEPVEVTRIGAFSKVRFDKRFEGAPFVLHVTLTSDADGLHLDAEAVLVQGGDGRWPAQRNVRIGFVMPADPSLSGWAPAYPDPAPVCGRPVRYCYGIQEPGMPRVGVPLYTVYCPERAGLSIAMPLDMRKVQLNMGPEPEDPGPLYVEVKLGSPTAGASLSYAEAHPEIAPSQVKVVRFTELFVGLIADRPLRFGVWLYGHAPHWRPGLGRLAEAYPDYFRVHPRMRAVWGSRLGGNVRVTPEDLAQYRRFGATCAWLHTHFYRHGEFIPPEAVEDPDFSFFCEPFSDRFPDNTVRKNREVVAAFADNGQAVFLYGHNMHCDPITVAQRDFFADVTRNEDGSVTESYHRQPVMFFDPESPFGSHQLRQMDLMIRLYPRIMGIALDNWAYGGIDFAHDDGITMFGHRPAANVNFSQQAMVETIARKWHGAGRLATINKARTVESMKGVDSMLTEAKGPEHFAMYAYMSLDRHTAPHEYDAEKDADYAEGVLQYTLEWGGQIGHGMVTADPEMSARYFRLIQGLRNRTWVFDPDPVTLPEGTRGNIFRIHPDSPWNPGDVVVTVVRPEVKAADRSFVEGMEVVVRLPEGEKFVKASWLGVEASDEAAVACEVVREEGALRIALPGVGAAGLLRLE